MAKDKMNPSRRERKKSFEEFVDPLPRPAQESLREEFREAEKNIRAGKRAERQGSRKARRALGKKFLEPEKIKPKKVRDPTEKELAKALFA